MTILLSIGNIKVDLLVAFLSLGMNIEFDFLVRISFERDKSSSWLHKIRSAGGKLIHQVHSSLVLEHYSLISHDSNSSTNRLSLINAWMSTFKDDEPGM